MSLRMPKEDHQERNTGDGSAGSSGRLARPPLPRRTLAGGQFLCLPFLVWILFSVWILFWVRLPGNVSRALRFRWVGNPPPRAVVCVSISIPFGDICAPWAACLWRLCHVAAAASLWRLSGGGCALDLVCANLWRLPGDGCSFGLVREPLRAPWAAGTPLVMSLSLGCCLSLRLLFCLISGPFQAPWPARSRGKGALCVSGCYLASTRCLRWDWKWILRSSGSS